MVAAERLSALTGAEQRSAPADRASVSSIDAADHSSTSIDANDEDDDDDYVDNKKSNGSVLSTANAANYSLRHLTLRSSSLTSSLHEGAHLSFSGGGFLGIYHVGVALAVRDLAPHVASRRVVGTSAGALAATCLVSGFPFEHAIDGIVKMAVHCRSLALGPLSPRFNIGDILREALETHMPDDAHLRSSGRLFVSVTRAATLRNELISTFDSREELIDVLIASCFIPYFLGVVPPRVRGARYIDGGFSCNIPVLDEHSITVSPFPGVSHIGPRCRLSPFGTSSAAATAPVATFISNASAAAPTPAAPANVSDTATGLLPTRMALELADSLMHLSKTMIAPPPAMLKQLMQAGYDDAAEFLRSHRLIACRPCAFARDCRTSLAFAEAAAGATSSTVLAGAAPAVIETPTTCGESLSPLLTSPECPKLTLTRRTPNHIPESVDSCEVTPEMTASASDVLQQATAAVWLPMLSSGSAIASLHSLFLHFVTLTGSCGNSGHNSAEASDVSDGTSCGSCASLANRGCAVKNSKNANSVHDLACNRRSRSFSLPTETEREPHHPVPTTGTLPGGADRSTISFVDNRCGACNEPVAQQCGSTLPQHLLHTLDLAILAELTAQPRWLWGGGLTSSGYADNGGSVVQLSRTALTVVYALTLLPLEIGFVVACRLAGVLKTLWSLYGRRSMLRLRELAPHSSWLQLSSEPLALRLSESSTASPPVDSSPASVSTNAAGNAAGGNSSSSASPADA